MISGPILIGLAGTELDAAGREQLQHPAVGGVVLFDRNFSDRAQIERLTGEIRAATEPRPLITIDQEGGRVQRLRDGFTRLPPLAAIGQLYAADAAHARDMAYRHGRVMAAEMLACGIDLSFAPVLDLDRGSSVIGDRSFSARPGVVADLGRSCIAGMHDAGMKATGKHFPGHGSVQADSHIDDVVDPRSLAEIQSTDMVPFRELAAELDAMMIAHVVYPEVDNVPAGYSRIWLQDILREGIGFAGVVFSDDLGMHAARTAGGLAERANRCLQAGCDLALVCHPDEVRELLADPGAPERDAGESIARLYGHPTISAAELEQARSEGIREWDEWRRSLEQLNP